MQTHMKKFLKQLLSLALVAMMLVSMVPVVYAEETEHTEHISDVVTVTEEETPELPAKSISVKGNLCYIYGDINGDGIVDKMDATELLYQTIYGDSTLDESWNFNEDEKADINNQDAIYLLEEADNIRGVVHAYGEPVWNWDMSQETPSVTVSYGCGCGDNHSEIPVQGAVEETNRVEATCTAAGSITYIATAEINGLTFTTEKMVSIPVDGHTLPEYKEGESRCITDRTCTEEGCDYVEKAYGHNYGEEKVTAATCTTAEVHTKTCEFCGLVSETTVGNIKGHTVSTEYTENLVDAAKCEYQLVYRCTVEGCGAEVSGETIEKHNYVAAITAEATCVTDGVKTYTCSGCGNTYTEAIPHNENAHNWDNGAEAEGITTYTCLNGCGQTKTTVNAKTVTETAVSQETLEKAGEVELQNAAVKLDAATLDTLSNAGEGDVSISVKPADISALGLAPETVQQMGTVYDFNMFVGENRVSTFNGGKVTVSIPYTLSKGEDADSIDIWYIKDDGTLVVAEGTYSNGKVTFTTEHFSYYTVTRLTPKQRCEKYGHNEKITSVAPTCTEEGYTLHVCIRCGNSEKTDLVSALGHDLEVVETAAGCTTPGVKKESCKNCNYEKEYELQSLGHAWEKETVEATCTAEGIVNATCTVCEEKLTEVLPATGNHDWENIVVEPTCEEKGYTAQTCKVCGLEEVTDEKPATGHSYAAEWDWQISDNGNLTVSIILVCEHDETHVFEKNATIGVDKQEEPTCEDEGVTTYKSTFSHNRKDYENKKDFKEPPKGHDIEKHWKFNSKKHYHACKACDKRADEADHNLDKGVVTAAATCTEKGVLTRSCACGYKAEEEIPAKGHNLVNGVCSDCGFKQNNCEHKDLDWVEETYTVGECKITISYDTCECGEVIYYPVFIAENCDFEAVETEGTDENGNLKYSVIATCSKCHVVVESHDYWKEGEACVGTHYTSYMAKDANGTELFNITGIIAEDVEHPLCKVEKTTDLTTYGMCEGTKTDLTCSCGESKTSNVVSDCDYIFDNENSTADTTVQKCTKCGVVRTQKRTITPEEDCLVKTNTLFTYGKDGKGLFSFENTFYTEYHEFETSVELSEGSQTCSDGYIVKNTCKNCGFSSTNSDKAEPGEHHNFFKEEIILPEGCCGETLRVFECPCGAESYCDIFEVCDINWNEPSSEETENGFIQTQTMTCSNCSLIIKDVTECVETELPCTFTGTTKRTVYYEDTELVTVSYVSEWHEDHDVSFDKELLGDSCEDGVEVSVFCNECKKVIREYTTYFHENTESNVHDLTALGMCGGTAGIYECACGEYGGIFMREDAGCNWVYLPDTSGNGAHVAQCSKCGVIRTRVTTSVALEGCEALQTETLKLEKEGNVLVLLEKQGVVSSHNWAYSFTLNKEDGSCSDGYTLHLTCKDCGATDSWQETPAEGMHPTYVVKDVNLADYGFCGGFIKELTCACGANMGTNINLMQCQWTSVGMDETTGVTLFQCSTCSQHYSFKQGQMYEDGCKVIFPASYTFYDKDKKVLTTVDTRMVMLNHNSEYTFVMDKENGTCADGYTVTEICKDCGYKATYHGSATNSYHNTYRVATYTAEEVGFGCGGEVSYYTCPCGEQSNVSVNSSCNFVNSYNPNTNSSSWDCSICGSSYKIISVSTPVDSCHSIMESTYYFYDKEGKETLILSSKHRNDNHAYMSSFRMLGESCEDGYYVTTTCKNCGESYEETYVRYDHMTFYTAEIDLKTVGACGGILNKYSCACGKETYAYYENQGCNMTYSYNTYKDEAGNIHDVNVETCRDCALRYQNDRYAIKKDGTCEGTEYTVTTVSIGDKLVDKSEGQRAMMGYHDYRTEATLVPGATDCNEGIVEKHICKDCGYSYSNEYVGNGHVTFHMEDEDIDLSQYGSVCESRLEKYACACGKNVSYSFSDYGCHFDQQPVDSWLGDDLEGQLTTNGWNYYGDSGYTYICSVTDPDCDCSLRRARYWKVDEENCVVRQYETWQLGYDAATGACQEEITIATGEVHGYHSYDVETEGTVEAGSTTTTYTCSKCQSTATVKNTYDEYGRITRVEEEAVNTQNNGLNKSFSSVQDTVIRTGKDGNDYGYPTVHYMETVSASGETSWNKYEYTYDWDNFDCIRIYTYTDSYGNKNEHSEECHFQTKYETIKSYTCTIPGEAGWRCGVCDTISDYWRWEVEPHHDWSWDSETGMYECVNCSLQNVNAASGDIIFEDLTEDNDTSYTVGYYNKKNVKFTYYVSVVEGTGLEESDEEYVLGGIQFTEITGEQKAISFDKEAVIAAAEETLAAGGYTGTTYSIRFTFVPEGADSNYDYAITFDPMTRN